MAEYRNVRIEDVRFNVVGHTRSVTLDLRGDCFTIHINPSIAWFKKDGLDSRGNYKCKTPWIQLMKVFDLEIDSGANLFDIKGKYCRLHLDGCEIDAISHIVDDEKFILMEDLQK